MATREGEAELPYPNVPSEWPAVDFTHAVPGPYHAVRDENGVLRISGAPDHVYTNDATVLAAVDALNRLHRNRR